MESHTFGSLDFPVPPPFTFTGIRYMPALGVKAAETLALRTLKGDLSALAYPLLTVQQKPGAKKFRDRKTAVQRVRPAPTLSEHLSSQCRRISDICTLEQNLEGFSVQRALIDVGPLDRQQKASLLAQVEQRLGNICTKLTPVTGYQRSAAHQLAVAEWNRKHRTGIAIRVELPDKPNAAFPPVTEVSAILELCGVSIRDCDLIIDAGFIDAGNLARLQRQAHAALFEYLNLGVWRTVTVLSGAFPRSISNLAYDTEHDIRRLDLDLATRLRWEFRRMRRHIIFGDCGMVAAAFVGSGGGSNPKANIRYTVKRHWKVLRRDDAPAMSTLCRNVVGAHYFAGKRFSSGDQWIGDFSLKDASRGRSEAWSQAGLSHHLAYAARQAARTLNQYLRSTCE